MKFQIRIEGPELIVDDAEKCRYGYRFKLENHLHYLQFDTGRHEELALSGRYGRAYLIRDKKGKSPRTITDCSAIRIP